MRLLREALGGQGRDLHMDSDFEMLVSHPGFKELIRAKGRHAAAVAFEGAGCGVRIANQWHPAPVNQRNAESKPPFWSISSANWPTDIPSALPASMSKR